jgi:hypothetical protein
MDEIASMWKWLGMDREMTLLALQAAWIRLRTDWTPTVFFRVFCSCAAHLDRAAAILGLRCFNNDQEIRYLR